MADQPGYTRIQNALLELLPTLPEAEMRILLVVIRKTAGWQKESDVISESQFRAATGMSRGGVINGVRGLLELGVLIRVPAKNNGFSYQVVHDVDSLKLYTKMTSLPSVQPVVHDVDSLIPQAVHDVDTQKKDLKEKEIKAPAQKAPRAKREKKEKDPTPEPIVLALAEACKIDRSIASYEQRQQLYQSAGILYRAGKKREQTTEQIADAIRYVVGWWNKHDWRGKQGQCPTPAQLRDVWPQAIAARPKPSTNGHSSSIPLPTKPNLAEHPVDLAKLAAMAEASRRRHT